MDGTTWTFVAFSAYLLVVVGLGLHASRASSSGVTEFFLGGRRLGRLVVALSAVVSGRSAWLMLGFAGLAWSRGLHAIWAAVGYVVVEGVLFLSYALRLRRFSERYDVLTVPDFFAVRFRDGGALRAVTVLVILVFLVLYVGAQLLSGGKTLAPSFGIETPTAVAITAAVVLVYTVLGGFLAVSLTDMVQAFVMLIGLVALPIVAVLDAGGVGALFDGLGALDPTLPDATSLTLGALIGFVGIGLGSPGQPHIVARYMAIDDPTQLRWAAVVGTAWNAVMAVGALFVGLCGRLAYPLAGDLPGGDPEKVYLVLAGEALPPVLFGIIVASVFAAIMSTADSQILVCASSVVRDLIEAIGRRGAPLPASRAVTISRVVVTVVVLLALGLGYLAQKSIFWLVLLAWGGLGAALGPVTILALYWRGTTRAGALAGVLAGTVVTITWDRVESWNAALYELVPGFAAAFVACLVVSWFTRPPEGVDEMFAVMDGDAPPEGR